MSHTRPRWAGALAVLLACSFQSTPAPRPPVDQELQEKIRSSVRSESREQMEQSLEELEGIGPERLVPQLLHYLVRADSTRDAMAFGVIVDILRVESDAIVAALVPFLGADDPASIAQTRNILGGYEGGASGRVPDFEIYRSYLEADLRAGKAPNPHLVQHLFASHPGAALLLLRDMSTLGREQSRELLWAEHVVAEALWRYEHAFLKPDEIDAAALEELRKMSRHAAWWVRLYVAEIMRQHAALRDAEIVAALERDANELVRQVFAAPTPRAEGQGEEE